MRYSLTKLDATSSHNRIPTTHSAPHQARAFQALSIINNILFQKQLKMPKFGKNVQAQNLPTIMFLTLRRSQPIWEACTTLHSVPCHPYTALNLHISNSFLTHSALSNPIFSCIPAINSSSYSPCGLRSSVRPNLSHFWRCVFYIFVLCIRLK